MWQIAMENVVAPLSRRVGTASAALVLGLGLTSEAASHVGLASASLVLLAADLAYSWIARKRKWGA